MDYLPAEFVRFVGDDENVAEVVEEAKGWTWTKGCEHALVVLADNRMALIRGGRLGIQLSRDVEGGFALIMEGVEVKVTRLAWHIHPFVTGPSDHDKEVLRVLEQEDSRVYEIGGDPEGTRFAAARDRR